MADLDPIVLEKTLKEIVGSDNVRIFDERRGDGTYVSAIVEVHDDRELLERLRNGLLQMAAIRPFIVDNQMTKVPLSLVESGEMKRFSRTLRER